LLGFGVVREEANGPCDRKGSNGVANPHGVVIVGIVAGNLVTESLRSAIRWEWSGHRGGASRPAAILRWDVGEVSSIGGRSVLGNGREVGSESAFDGTV
jgi:hypothetical protein